MGPFTETKWIVCYGEEVVHFLELEPGHIENSGQPNCEIFEDEENALIRYEAISTR